MDQPVAPPADFDGVAHAQLRAQLLADLAALVAQRDAINRSSPGAAIALARVAGKIAGKTRELREVQAALEASTAVLDALAKRAVVDKALMDMGFEPEPGYIERTYGAGWHRKPAAPVLDAVAPAETPPALDPVMALAAVTDRMADLVETQAGIVKAALNVPPAPVIVQPATVDVNVTATIPPRQTVTDVQRNAKTGDIERTITTEREAPAA